MGEAYNNMGCSSSSESEPQRTESLSNMVQPPNKQLPVGKKINNLHFKTSRGEFKNLAKRKNTIVEYRFGNSSKFVYFLKI